MVQGDERMEKWHIVRAALPAALALAAGILLALEALGLVPSAVVAACREALVAALKR